VRRSDAWRKKALAGDLAAAKACIGECRQRPCGSGRYGRQPPSSQSAGSTCAAPVPRRLFVMNATKGWIEAKRGWPRKFDRAADEPRVAGGADGAWGRRGQQLQPAVSPEQFSTMRRLQGSELRHALGQMLATGDGLIEYTEYDSQLSYPEPPHACQGQRGGFSIKGRLHVASHRRIDCC
jgi:hypothetical protein